MLYTGADKPMTRGKISFARDIHCYPYLFYISFARPASLYSGEYVYIYMYLTA